MNESNQTFFSDWLLRGINSEENKIHASMHLLTCLLMCQPSRSEMGRGCGAIAHEVGNMP
jgi:hypothetical protein